MGAISGRAQLVRSALSASSKFAFSIKMEVSVYGVYALEVSMARDDLWRQHGTLNTGGFKFRCAFEWALLGTL